MNGIDEFGILTIIKKNFNPTLLINFNNLLHLVACQGTRPR
jgi:hypothetical protein